MIDYRELDLIEDNGYDIYRDKDGVVYSVTLPSQKELIKIGKFQFMIGELQDSYNKLSNKKQSEETYDKLDALYSKLENVMRGMFLMVLNMNTQGKQFSYDDIKYIPFSLIQAEYEGYMKYMESRLKN